MVALNAPVDVFLAARVSWKLLLGGDFWARSIHAMSDFGFTS